MKKTKLGMAAAFIALAATASAVQAADRSERRGDHAAKRFERMDADKSGDVTFEEFSAAMGKRVTDADADGDGKITVAELADHIERMRAQRAAQRIIDRLDANGDGVLTKEEIESRQKKRFALLDRNDDGKIERQEMPKHGRHGKRQ